ncbi:hypothetical protein CLOM621_05334 [Clostridium sp. M62/1]|nr:hypothetical protein CLOM621_05334 [Clostridium sp. M62/1]
MRELPDKQFSLCVCIKSMPCPLTGSRVQRRLPGPERRQKKMERGKRREQTDAD